MLVFFKGEGCPSLESALANTNTIVNRYPQVDHLSHFRSVFLSVDFSDFRGQL